MTGEPPAYLVGCDVGGTFTDVVLIDARDGRHVTSHKVLTDVAAPERGIIAALAALRDEAGAAVPLSAVREIGYGTTLAANAVIERKGARTALLATEGFRDVLEMGRESRYDMFDIFADFAAPLVPRYLRKEVRERTYAGGEQLLAVDREQVLEAVSYLTDQGVEAIAVCLLHSYANPSHELEVRDLIARECPALAVSLSSEILPQIGEFERTSTTVANAYVQPLIGRHLRELGAAFEKQSFGGRFSVMLSNGTTTSPETASRYPVRIIESGPAGGIIASQYFAERAGITDIVAFDMGGTTAKASVVVGGALHRVTELEVARVHRAKAGSGIHLQIPAIGLLEIGAGGGSIARISALGTLQVGPDSAGSSPGPACYGLGGVEPTVTDSNALLGYLNPDYFAAGTLTLDLARAAAAIDDAIATPLGLATLEAAWGIHSVINETMAAAIRVHLSERGSDPRLYTIVATGGAGPVHAVDLARRLGAKQVLVPPAAGTASALGLLIAPPAFEHGITVKTQLDDFGPDTLRGWVEQLESIARHHLGAGRSEEEQYRREVTLDAKYVGQSGTVALDVSSSADIAAATLRALFEKSYVALYGLVHSGVGIEIVNVRLLLSASHGRPYTPPRTLPDGDSARGTRAAYCSRQHALVDHMTVRRNLLFPGTTLPGRVIVEDEGSTIVVADGATATVRDDGSLLIRLGAL